MTNGEMIRAMDDEELASVIESYVTPKYLQELIDEVNVGMRLA